MKESDLVKPVDRLELVIEGGLQITYTIGTTTKTFSGRSPKEIVDSIERFHKTINIPRRRQLIIEYVLSIWQARDPLGFDNALKPAGKSSVLTQNTGLMRNPMTVHHIGPMCWNWLNLFGVYFTYQSWITSINMVTHLIDPQSKESDTAGCSKCYTKWMEYIQKHPPTFVENKHDAARWVNDAHNHVNKSRGVKEFTYERMVINYGAPISHENN